jgi:dihydrofolate reductase
MPIFHAIAAMSENRVIGNQGKIPWHIPEDFRWFKHKTMGGTLIMGRKTFRSIGRPLPGRTTVLLSRHTSVPGVETCMDLRALDRTLATSPQPYWVCGGAEIYRQFLPECQTLHLTRVKRTIEGDAFFPEFENDFSLEQVIHENESFRVERWFRKGWTHHTVNEPWPFTEPQE